MSPRTLDHFALISGSILIILQGRKDIKYASGDSERLDIEKLMVLSLAMAAFGWYLAGKVHDD